jgi:hypothetical protein
MLRTRSAELSGKLVVLYLWLYKTLFSFYDNSRGEGGSSHVNGILIYLILFFRDINLVS